MVPQVGRAQGTQTAPVADNRRAESDGNGVAPTATETSEVVVTGSRIPLPSADQVAPALILPGSDLFNTGLASVGDQLNQLPEFHATYSQQNSTRYLGTSGLNLLDLRGLGIQRTLVLVDGQRRVGGDILTGGVSTDINTIPIDLIERVEVVTGGDSAIYGSDAIAGVVNFVLKKDYNGTQFRAQTGLSTFGDAESRYLSALTGRNFADKRGNVTLNLELSQQDPTYASSRPDLAQVSEFVQVAIRPQNAVGPTGIPERLFYRNIRESALSSTGVVLFGGTSLLNCGTPPSGGFYNCPLFILSWWRFDADHGSEGWDWPPTERSSAVTEWTARAASKSNSPPRTIGLNAHLGAHFTISPTFEPFLDASLSHTVTGGAAFGPAFFTGSALGDPAANTSYGNREQPRLSNPYLSDQARSLILNETAQVGTPLTSPDQRFSVVESLLGLGIREEDATRDTYQLLGAFEAR